MIGKLIVIGAGAAYDLMTLRGLNALKEADIILYDRLVDERLLGYSEAETVNVGKMPYKCDMKQEEINRLIMEELQKGKTVVRLKGGDSTLFSRVVEELDAARSIGADVQVIPGVTSASATMSKIESALTSRETTSGVMFVTGHKSAEKLAEAYDWESMVKLGLTIVVYMGVKNMQVILEHLRNAGLNGDTPVLIAENVESSGERFFFGTADTIQDVADKNTIAYPALLVIGEVVAHSPAFTSMQNNQQCNIGGCACKK